MLKLRVGFVFALCSVALIACTRLITEELPTTPIGPGAPGPGAPQPGPTPTPITLKPLPSPHSHDHPDTDPKAHARRRSDAGSEHDRVRSGATPLARINVKVHNDQGEKKVLDSAPNVCSGGPGFEKFCETIMNDPSRRCCPPRPEGHPQREACDGLLMGHARDTGRVGPTWTMNGKPCVDSDSTVVPRCVNHPTNQYLLFIYGTGKLTACAENGYCGELTVQ